MLKLRRRLDTSVAFFATSSIGIPAEACGAGTFWTSGVSFTAACPGMACSKKKAIRTIHSLPRMRRHDTEICSRIILYATFITPVYQQADRKLLY
ncbi:MAG: hypothetical protein ACXU9X_09060 [Thermodesulfobacteriota bacterium]